MSMPQPIHVALVGSTTESVLAASKHLRLAPGIGAPTLAALDAHGGADVVQPSRLAVGTIDLWLCLSPEAHEVCKALHTRDRQLPGYAGGFYQQKFPEGCVRIRQGGKQRQSLSAWATRIAEAWYESS